MTKGKIEEHREELCTARNQGDDYILFACATPAPGFPSDMSWMTTIQSRNYFSYYTTHMYLALIAKESIERTNTQDAHIVFDPYKIVKHVCV